MSPRFQNKLFTVCVALLASMVLLGVAVVLEVIAPKGALGWLIKTVPLVVAIPAALVGYEAICDWYYKRFILRENQKLYEKLDLRETRYSDHGRWEPRLNGARVRTAKSPPVHPNSRRSDVAAILRSVGNGKSTPSSSVAHSKSWFGQ